MYKTIGEIKAANAAAGHYFFSATSMRFADSIVYPEVYEGRIFITSEQQDEDTPRRWKIRQADKRGHIKTVSDFIGFESFDECRLAVNLREYYKPYKFNAIHPGRPGRRPITAEGRTFDHAATLASAQLQHGETLLDESGAPVE